MIGKDWLAMHAMALWGIVEDGSPRGWTEYRISWS